MHGRENSGSSTSRIGTSYPAPARLSSRSLGSEETRIDLEAAAEIMSADRRIAPGAQDGLPA
jgi:hypothetical protein